MNTLLLTKLFIAASLQYGLPNGLLSSLCYVESKHDINALHKDDGNSNSVGICQVKLKTAKWLGFKGTEKQLMNPKTNIQYAAKYLAKQRVRYDGDNTSAIISYNMGSTKGFTKTKYSVKVNKQWSKYEM